MTVDRRGCWTKTLLVHGQGFIQHATPVVSTSLPLRTTTSHFTGIYCHSMLNYFNLTLELQNSSCFTGQTTIKQFFVVPSLLCSYSFIQVVCLMTGPKPLPKRALHIVWSRASSFKWKYPLLSTRSSSSFLRLLPRLPVTSIPPFYLSFSNPL